SDPARMSPATPTPFTVGIPVYNEEAILVLNTERLLAFLDGLGREYEVIIGSNGSTDSTTALGVDLSRRFPHVSFFHLPERGVGLAFREFVARARYPLLVSADMDLSVDLSFVPAALELLETHDIVVGSKKLGHQKRSWLRRFGSDLFLRIARLLLGMGYEDYSIAAKAYRVETCRRFADRNESFSLIDFAHHLRFNPGNFMYYRVINVILRGLLYRVFSVSELTNEFPT